MPFSLFLETKKKNPNLFENHYAVLLFVFMVKFELVKKISSCMSVYGAIF